jgi:hypothetical protein
VLKGKYYPNGDFISTRKKKRASDTWRVILFGREVLQKGIVKRIGPGNTIKIWEDNWLPGAVNLKPLVRPPGAILVTVEELFLPGTRQWEVELVHGSFDAWDAEEILKLRQGTHMEEDIVAWNYEKHGLYSVHSAYRLLKAEQSQEEASKLGEAGSSSDGVMWKKLWRLRVPPKIRLFWWRAVNNFLPTKLELQRRHVEREAFCGESLFHVVFVCTMARRFWQAAAQLFRIKVPELHPASWTRDVLSGVVGSDRVMCFIVCGAWALWTGRNNRKHGKCQWDHDAAVRHVSAMLEDLICSNQRHGSVATDARVLRAQWVKLDSGWVKVNTNTVSSWRPAMGLVVLCYVMIGGCLWRQLHKPMVISQTHYRLKLWQVEMG